MKNSTRDMLFKQMVESDRNIDKVVTWMISRPEFPNDAAACREIIRVETTALVNEGIAQAGEFGKQHLMETPMESRKWTAAGPQIPAKYHELLVRTYGKVIYAMEESFWKAYSRGCFTADEAIIAKDLLDTLTSYDPSSLQYEDLRAVPGANNKIMYTFANGDRFLVTIERVPDGEDVGD